MASPWQMESIDVDDYHWQKYSAALIGICKITWIKYLLLQLVPNCFAIADHK